MRVFTPYFVTFFFLGTMAANADPLLDEVDKYYSCVSTLAWATPSNGENMIRRNHFQKAVVADQPVYVLSSSQYPPGLEEKHYFFGPGGAISTNLGEAPKEHTERTYLRLDHHYLNISVPGVPAAIIGDLAIDRSWGGLDSYLTALDRTSAQGRDFETKHPQTVGKPLKTKKVTPAEAAAAMKAEALLAIQEVTKSPLASLEKRSPKEYQKYPHDKNIFDRFKEALRECGRIQDPEIQDAITAAHMRVAAELAIYLQRYPAKEATFLESVCKLLGIED